MKKGYLSQYFYSSAAKCLSAAETDCVVSRQHEFNSANDLKFIFGESSGKAVYPAKSIYLSDNGDPIIEEGTLTWYDARQKEHEKHNAIGHEYRMSISVTRASQVWNTGDVFIIAKRPDGTVLTIAADEESSAAQQMLWLFGFSNLNQANFSVRKALTTERDKICFTSRLILESIGIVIEEQEKSFLEDMLRRFDGKFPSTKIFSEYARRTLPDVIPQAETDDDALLMAWLEQEEILSRTFEKHLVNEKIQQGFANNIDDFFSFSSSLINRRTKWIKFALEHHIEFLFQERGVRCAKNFVLENGMRPDFIFPGKKEYLDLSFSPAGLTMLGLKASCKDRWRQILSEADRIPKKHLLTLEAPISKKQTEQMRAKNVQLVLPAQLHQAYLPEQRDWLINVSAFVQHVLEKQKRASSAAARS
ncbi:MAG: type II restriction endonuclease [Candidatus Electronema sp. V4]|uniref:type II restriction endonuclease n=1 Tax=Candidatus Electronema sp. V4 TaxID=3454756 RepID=UPI0040554C23